LPINEHIRYPVFLLIQTRNGGVQVDSLSGGKVQRSKAAYYWGDCGGCLEGEDVHCKGRAWKDVE
jgi:hypothetical protein